MTMDNQAYPAPEEFSLPEGHLLAVCRHARGELSSAELASLLVAERWSREDAALLLHFLNHQRLETGPDQLGAGDAQSGGSFERGSDFQPPLNDEWSGAPPRPVTACSHCGAGPGFPHHLCTRRACPKAA